MTDPMTPDENREAALALILDVLRHLPPGLNTTADLRPVAAHGHSVLTEVGHLYVLDDDTGTVSRLVETPSGGHERTVWRAGVEIARHALIDPPDDREPDR